MQRRLLSGLGTAEQAERSEDRTVAKASTSKKPISLHPLSFKEAITSLLEIVPPKELETEDDRSSGNRKESPQA